MEGEIGKVVYETEKLHVPARGELPAHNEWAAVQECQDEKPARYMIVYNLDLPPEHAANYATKELLFESDFEKAKNKADEIYKTIKSKLNQQ